LVKRFVGNLLQAVFGISFRFRRYSFHGSWREHLQKYGFMAIRNE
jgi:hypothetical protein